MLRVVAILLLVFQASASNTFKVRNLEFSTPPRSKLQVFLLKENLVDFTNFEGKFLHGGFIPPDGTEIAVLVRDFDGKSMDQIIAEDISDCTQTSTSQVKVAGQTAHKFVCDDNYKLFKLRVTRVYLEHGSSFYKFDMTVNEPNANSRSLQRTFDNLLATARFVQ